MRLSPKIIILFSLLAFFASQIHAEKASENSSKWIKVEASCSICKFDMEGNDCELAIRFEDGLTYLVEGTHIDAHGDAHAEDGFCNAIREAKVIGMVKDGVFVAEELKLSE